MDAPKIRRQKSKPRGRPSMPMTEGKRFALGLRVTAELRKALESAAKHSGRSISQEIEIRLEQTFAAEEAMGGAETHGLCHLISGAARIIEGRRSKSWSKDWETFLAARGAWHKIIDGLRPYPPAEWKERFEALDAANPGPPPKLKYAPGARSGLFALGSEEYQRAHREWEAANSEWSTRDERYKALLESHAKQLTSLSDLGREVGEALLSPNPIAQALSQASRKES